jgi:hypothetical protein
MKTWTQRRVLASVPFQGSVQSIPVDRDGVLGMIAVRLGFTITNAATGPATPRWNALARLIRNLRLQVEGQDTVIELPGEVIAARHVFEFGCRAPGMDATVVLTNSAVTVYNVRLVIPMFLPRARRAEDTSIDLRPYTSVNLLVNWGTINDIFVTPNGATISAVTCQPEAYYLMDEAPRLTPDSKPYMARVLDVVDVPVTQTNPQFTIKVDGGRGILHRGLHVIALVDDQLSNAILDAGQFELKSGGRVWLQREGLAVRQDAQSDWGIPPSEVAALVGNYRLELSHYGQMQTLINTDDLTSDLNLRVGTALQAGVNRLLVARETIRPLAA